MDIRHLPLLEAYGGGPADGMRLPVAGAEVIVVEGAFAWVYRVAREDDGTRFLHLAFVLPRETMAAA